MKRLMMFSLAAIVAVGLALGLAACGDDDDDEMEATTAAAPVTLALTGESTTLVLDEGTAAVLAENSVSVAPIEPSTASDAGIAFPITGGSVEAESLAGTIEHSGGLTFSAGGTDLALTDFVIDTAAGTLSATAGDAQVVILDVDLSGLQRSDDNGTIVLEDIALTLSADGAGALNDTFGVTLFTEGLAIGTATVRATA
jgi:hypothetical protein